MVRTKICPSSVTLTLGLPERFFFSSGTSTRDGEQLCQIILKSIYNCGSYGADKVRRTDARTYTQLSLFEGCLLSLFLLLLCRV